MTEKAEISHAKREVTNLKVKTNCLNVVYREDSI